MSGSQRQPPRSNGPTILALLALMAMAVGLLFLSALVLPQLFGFAVVVVGFFVFIAFHYVVWGWWLSKISADDEDVAQ